MLLGCWASIQSVQGVVPSPHNCAVQTLSGILQATRRPLFTGVEVCITSTEATGSSIAVEVKAGRQFELSGEGGLWREDGYTVARVSWSEDDEAADALERLAAAEAAVELPQLVQVSWVRAQARPS